MKSTKYYSTAIVWYWNVEIYVLLLRNNYKFKILKITYVELCQDKHESLKGEEQML